MINMETNINSINIFNTTNKDSVADGNTVVIGTVRTTTAAPILIIDSAAESF
jgi:hypothetical protein